MAEHQSYQGLARKYRPQTFEDLVGQEAVAQSIQKSLSQGRVAHGHLMAGPRGVGKTTSARILARALNCEQGPTPQPCGQCRHCIDIANGTDLDVIEIDAASNTKVEQMREMLERVVTAPFSARYKVYIIDEVHMLSMAAFNALLKTLEEPPPQVAFIFATTELDKVPETIRSRCTIHTFRRITNEDIARRLAQVTGREGVSVGEDEGREIFGLIARSVEGGMRDALVTLDQLLALTDNQPTVEAAIKLLGLADMAALSDTVTWLAQGKTGELLGMIEELVARGRSLERFVKSLIAYLRDLMLIQAGAGEQLLSMNGDRLKEARTQAESIPQPTLFNILNQLFELEEKLKQSTQARFLVEFTFLRIAAVRPVVPIDDIMKRIQAIPDAGFEGASQPSPPAGESAKPARRAAVSPSEPQSALVMHDSAPETPVESAPEKSTAEPLTESARPSSAPAVASAPPASASGPLARFDSDELIEAIIERLPEQAHFLGRYLRKASRLVAEDAVLRVIWPSGSRLSRRVVEKPDNIKAIETALEEICGQSIKLRSEAGEASAPAAQSATAAPQTAAVMNDSGLEPEPAPLESDEDAFTDESAFNEPPAAPAQGVLQRPAVPTRSALEKAKALLEGNDEASRRIKMLREMFNGRLIDEMGQPLSL